jgi:CRISPR/Cas system-associated exonuclease Cas4 (RecB family)
MQPQNPTFLADVADQLYAQHGDLIPELTVLFPNKRTGQIFQRCLAERVNKPTWSPQILTLSGLVEKISQLSIAPTLNLVLELYQSFQALQPSQESFEQFYGWGAMLLQDFDIIDKSLVHPDQLFTNLLEQKALEVSYSYLTDTQKSAIRSFWKSFDQRLSKHQSTFLRLWKLLPGVYKHFTKRLLSQGIGYEGLAYKTVYQALKKGDLTLPHSKLAIVGFHALYPAEEQIFALLQEKLPTEFYWDVDAYYMEDEQQEAGYYLRAHEKKVYFQKSFQKPFPNRIQASPKNIQFFAVASEVGQVQIVGNQLQALIQEQGTNFNPSQTAIILANESLFLPMLDALPKEIQQITTTLGYPLRDMATYQLIEQLLALQVAIRQPDCPPGYLPTQAILSILNHPHVRRSSKESAIQISRLLTKNQGLYTRQADLAGSNRLYQVLFQPIQAQEAIIPYLLDSLVALDTLLLQGSIPLLATEKKAFNQLYQQLSKLQQSGLKLAQVSLQEFVQLFRQVIAPIKLDFQEASLDGIQLLRMWETNNLDFAQVFILGMNEGSFPTPYTHSSLIPYNLRKGYGLPTADTFQASLDAYYFYRLLQRSQKVYITYSTQSLGGSNQEMSRYLWQLLYETNLPIKQHLVTSPIPAPSISPIVIEKDERVRQALDRFMVKPGQESDRLTPSAINSYLTCSLQFYFRYIAKIQTTPPIQEANEALLFGNLLHQAIENLYKPFLQSKIKDLIQKSDLQALKAQVMSVVRATLAQCLHQERSPLDHFTGSHTIIQAVISQVIEKLLEMDQAYAPFELIGLEMGRQEPLQADFELDAANTIGLRGIIDRVDTKQGIIRVIDYKTGNEDKLIKSIADLFDRNTPKRNQSALQLLFYAWLYQQNQDDSSSQVLPMLFNTRALFESDFDPHLFIKLNSGHESIPITDISFYQAEFEAGLRAVLGELIDPLIPFQQTDDIAACQYCPYKGICQR